MENTSVCAEAFLAARSRLVVQRWQKCVVAAARCWPVRLLCGLVALAEDSITSGESLDLHNSPHPPPGHVKYTTVVPGHFISASFDLVLFSAGWLKRTIWLSLGLKPAFAWVYLSCGWF